MRIEMNPIHRRRPTASLHTAAWLLAAALAACGGGSDDSEPRADAPSGPGPTCGLANFEADLLQRVNAARAAGAQCGAHGAFAAAGPLQWHGVLVAAAARHSQDMASHNFFSHTGSDNSSPAQRVTDAGYGWHLVAENIAAGCGDQLPAADTFFVGACSQITCTLERAAARSIKAIRW